MSQPEPTEPNKSLPPALQHRKPWPMWPIALSIVVFIGIYTYIQLEYRKEGNAYEPFKAIMDRMNATVEKNMYDWWGLKATQLGELEALDKTATVTEVPTEDSLETSLPPQLKFYISSKPILLPGKLEIDAPKALKQGTALRLRLKAPAALTNDDRLTLLAFYKEGQIYLLPTLFVDKIEDIAAELASEPTYIGFEFPTDPIDAETIQVTLIGDEAIYQWSIDEVTLLPPADDSEQPEEG